MKKIVIVISAFLLFTVETKAQTPDFNFENWTTILGTLQDPQGWASLNTASIFGTPQSVFKETAAPYAGTSSAIIQTVVLTGISLPGIDTAGLLITAAVQLSPPSFNFGKPYTVRSAALSFASKYTPVNNDSAFVYAYLTKWNVNHQDTIARGYYSTGTTTNTYSVNSINMIYDASFGNTNPDSMHIYISSSIFLHDGAQVGSTFYIDSLAWSGIVIGINDIDGKMNTVSVCPNPASNTVSIVCSVKANLVEITDITGRKLGTYSMNNNKTTIQTTTFAKGMYIYNMLNDKQEIIHRGKFEIAR